MRAHGDNTKGLKVMWLENHLGNTIVESNLVVLVFKNCHREYDCQNYLCNLVLAMDPLDLKMSVPLHFVSTCGRETGTETKKLTKDQVEGQRMLTKLVHFGILEARYVGKHKRTKL